MKLLQCYISNFGMLSEWQFSFSEGLNVLCRENGCGKSTLAAFLKAMFYGFPKYGGRNVTENERKRYMPWQGGKFGGSLSFSHNGKSYRVTRSWGKTPAGDTFSLTDCATGAPSSDFSEKLGEELFRLDAASFVRCVFVPQLAVGNTGITDAIRAKLVNLVEDTNDVNNFEAALAALRRSRSERCAFRGSGGKVGELAQKAAALEEQLEKAVSCGPQLTAVTGDIADTAEKNAALRRQIAALDRDYQQALNRKNMQLQRERLAELQSDIEKNKLQLAAAERKYPAGFPSETELRLAGQRLAELRLAEQLQKRLTPPEAERGVYEAEAPFWADEVRAAESLDLLERRSDDISVRRQADFALPCALYAGSIGLLIAGVLLAGIPGLALLAAGVGVLAAAVFATVRRLRQRRRSAAQRAAVQSMLSAFGVSAPVPPYCNYLPLLRQRQAAYRSAVAGLKSYAAEYERISEQRRQAGTTLEVFFRRYGLSGASPEAVLAAAAADVRGAVFTRKALAQAEEKYRAYIAGHPELCVGPAPEPTVPPAPEDIRQSAQQLKDALDCGEERLRALRLERERLSAIAETVPALRDELARISEEKQTAEQQCALLDRTVEYLSEARSRLAETYGDRVTGAFRRYAALLLRDRAGSLLADRELNLRVEVQGEPRELAAFSPGIADTVNLCMRLALAEALFSAEMPFLVLDDPFVNLDDARAGGAMAVLKQIAEDRQVIYLTCSRSRC